MLHIPSVGNPPLLNINAFQITRANRFSDSVLPMRLCFPASRAASRPLREPWLDSASPNSHKRTGV
jgi:hypothetical protein